MELLCASVSSPESELRSAHFMGLAGELSETILVKPIAHLVSFMGKYFSFLRPGNMSYSFNFL